MTLPTFLVIGAQKAGTTSLFSYLQAHPEATCTPVRRCTSSTGTGDRGWAWYEEQFADAGWRNSSPLMWLVGECTSETTSTAGASPDSDVDAYEQW